MKIGTIKTKNLAIIILVFIFLFLLINNIIYLRIDTRPPAWDQSWHKSISLSRYYEFTNKGENDLRKVSFILHERSLKYPHLFHISSTPLYFLFGVSDDVSDMTNMIYFLVLIISVYLIGKELYSREAGLLASFIVSTYPIIFGLSRLYLLDFSIVALVSLSIYFLIIFKNKPSLKNATLLIISIIIGFFLKQIFIIFVALPLAFVLIYTLFKLFKQNKRKRLYLILGSFACLVIASLLLFIYIDKFSGGFLIQELIKDSSFENLKLNLPSIFYNFINVQVSFVYFLLFLFSFCFFKKIKEKTIFLLWIIFPILFLAYNNTLSAGRYLMPVLPAIAIISTLGVFSLKNKKLRISIIICLIIFALVQFFDISYAGQYRKVRIKEMPVLDKISIYRNQMYIIDSAKKENWQIENILDFIKKDCGNKQVVVEVIADSQRFNDYNFAYLTYKKGYYNMISAGFAINPIQADYLVIKTKDKGTSSWRYYLVERAFNLFNENKDKFDLIKEYPLPDGSKAQLYKKN